MQLKIRKRSRSEATQGPPCPLCFAPSRHRFGVRGRSIFECQSCGFALLSPPLDSEELLKLYQSADYHSSWMTSGDAASDGSELRYFTSLRRRMAMRLRLLLGGAGRVLEVGCGSGEFLNHCREVGLSPVGLEVSEPAANLCRSRYGLPVIVGAFSSDSVSAETFDAVVMHQFIEHVPDPGPILRDAFRALRPGGIVLLTTPHFNGVSTLLFGSGNYTLDPNIGHCSWFSKRSLRRALEHAGFNVIQLWTDQLFGGNFVDAVFRFLRIERGSESTASYQSPRRCVQDTAVGTFLFGISDRMLNLLSLGDQLGAFARKPGAGRSAL
jgi:SAM-dependent methyltransferase